LANYPINCNVELPISLNRSQILGSLLKEDLCIRVYFKSNIFYSGSASSITLTNVALNIRAKELSSQCLSYLYKQPKINHITNKRVFFK